MPFCQNCGAELPEGSNFCLKCGQAATNGNSRQEYNYNQGSITFIRKPCSVAKLMKTKVVVDGLEYGELKENEQLVVNLPYGVHSVTLKCAMNPALNVPVQIGSTNTVFFPFKISMSGKPARINEPVNTVNSNGVVTGGKPKKKKTGLIIFTIIAVFIIIGIIASSGDSTSSSTSTTKVTSTPKPTATPEPSFTAYTGTVGNWEITVNDFYYTENVSIGLLREYRAEEGSKYCIINLTVKNLGNQSATFLPYIAYGNDTVAKIIWQQYEYTRSELIWADDNLSSETLNPLVSTSGNIAFELPNNVIESDTPPVLVIRANGQAFECELVKSN